MRLLRGWEVHFSIFHAYVLACVGSLASGKEPFPHNQELICHRITFVMADEHTIRCGLRRISAGDDVDEKPALRKPINVAAIRAANVAEVIVGRTATRTSTAAWLA